LASVDIKANLESVQRRIEQACLRSGRKISEVKLIAVTKTIEPASIEEAFKLGVRHFGENRVQEAARKIGLLTHLKPQATWHMIGHLQSNKVKQALEVFDVIQGLDSIDLAIEINRRASRKIPVMLEVNVGGEASKSGFSLTVIEPAFDSISRLTNLEITGLMTVAPALEDPEQVRPFFRKLRELRDTHLSIGMSNDFEAAVEEGSTMVRIGRAIFGDR
jgi:pyridoxal phosphate enzyme (YggS family)